MKVKIRSCVPLGLQNSRVKKNGADRRPKSLCFSTRCAGETCYGWKGKKKRNKDVCLFYEMEPSHRGGENSVDAGGAGQ